MARFPEVDTPPTAPRLHVRVKVIRRECRSHLPATGVYCGAELISPWEALALEAQACPGAAPRCAGTPKLSLSEPTQTDPSIPSSVPPVRVECRPAGRSSTAPLLTIDRVEVQTHLTNLTSRLVPRSQRPVPHPDRRASLFRTLSRSLQDGRPPPQGLGTGPFGKTQNALLSVLVRESVGSFVRRHVFRQ
jgi:hypothetical protein